MKNRLFIWLFLLGTLPLFAQEYTCPEWGTIQVQNGYSQTVSGDILPYHSIHSDFIKTALLTRCTSGNMEIRWKTGDLHINPQDPYVYIIWVFAHSTGTNSGTRFFTLETSLGQRIRITTREKEYPEYQIFKSDKDASALLLHTTKIDIHKDVHGYAVLRLPASSVVGKNNITLRLCGDAQNSNDWFMTYQFAYKTTCEVKPLPVILQNDSEQIALIKLFHVGKSGETLRISCGKKSFTQKVKTGYSVFEMPFSRAKHSEKIRFQLATPTTRIYDSVHRVEPVIDRIVYFVHHSHNDIGYSHLQEDVEQIQNRNIEQALTLVQQYPDSFVWNIESLWAVENFLRVCGPEKEQAFIQAVKKGQIGLSGFYANTLSGLMTPDELQWNIDYAKELQKKYDLPIHTVMLSDIPGMNSDIISVLAKQGIRYISNGPNYMPTLPDKGDRIGSTLRDLGDKIIWWKSIHGKDSVMLWTCGQGYSAWHGFKSGEIAERGLEKVADYMSQLFTDHYPYELVQWRYNIGSDNGPVDSSIARYIATWNIKYKSPVLKMGTAQEVSERFDMQYGHFIPTYTGDFAPYWEDGAYSSAKEESDIRLFARTIRLAEKTAAEHAIQLPRDYVRLAKRSIVMFQEHTWGAHCSTTHPDSSFTLQQWAYKKRFADSAQWYVTQCIQPIRAFWKTKAMTQTRFHGITLSPIGAKAGIQSLQLGGKDWAKDTANPLFSFIYQLGWNQTTSYALCTQQQANSIHAQLPGCGEIELRCISKDEQQVHIQIRWIKNAVREKESMHIGMPFSLQQANYQFGRQGGSIQPNRDLIPGSNHDFYCANSWQGFIQNNQGIVWYCPQFALTETDSLIDENRSKAGVKIWHQREPQTAQAFIYLLNNYWHTNYKADQSGELVVDVFLKAVKEWNPNELDTWSNDMETQWVKSHWQ